MRGLVGFIACIAMLSLSMVGQADAHGGGNVRFRATPLRPNVGPVAVSARFNGHHHGNQNFRFNHHNQGFGFVPTRGYYSGFAYAPPVALVAPQGYGYSGVVQGFGGYAPVSGVQAYGYQVQGVGFANPGCGRLLLGY